MRVGVLVAVVLMPVALMDVVDVARLVGVVAVGVALVYVVLVLVGMVLMSIALVDVVDVARLIGVMLMPVAFVYVVFQHHHTFVPPR